MPDQQQNPDGSWSEAKPLEPSPGYDAEVYDRCPDCGFLHWRLFRDGTIHVARGCSRTRLGAHLAIFLVKRRDVWRAYQADRLERRMRGR